jgi:uncharacterized protein YdeI (YjbR/CyaY-like superfamily)
MDAEKPLERTVLAFANPSEFETWLEENHEQASGVWLRLAKKGAGQASVTYAQALDAALCYGWIDGQKARLDEQAWLQYFARRKATSLWSQVNRGHIERLTVEGRMRPAGLAAVEAAKVSGQWQAAYQPTRSRELPPELEEALALSPRARAFFDTLTSQNRFAFVFRTATAKKPETRLRRVKEFIRMLENGEVFYP